MYPYPQRFAKSNSIHGEVRALDTIKFLNLLRQFVVSDIPVRLTSKTDFHDTYAILHDNIEWRE
jgi:hypothetical protein